ncbi:MAG: hypothetical protein Q8N23_26930 [Archangium sp.]|nr:hypothetical protein [Archangium sp.]MDP3156340.1 hypothetical protein [Archangium sp.]MDP3570384.1 hypothetical protein [Archangium sp.]
MRSLLVVGLLMATAACEKSSSATSSKRASIARTGGTTFEIIPAEGQHGYCLAYTVSRSGLTRQLTMSRSNQSYECAAGRPIGGHPYKMPLNEGPVRVFVFFTSQPVNAASVSQQILDANDRQALTLMNMRLPGQAHLEVLDFTPEEDVAATVGALVGFDAGVDGGQR